MKSWSAQLKTCCRIGGWNHHSGHRAMIVCNKCTQRSAIVFLTPGQLAGQMHTPRIHCKEHTQTKKLFSNTKSGPKNGVNFRTYNLLPCLLRAGFRGRWLVCETGLATQLFSSFCPIIWGSIFGQHGRSCNDSLCATCSKFPCAVIIICDQHSYYDYKHTHTVRAHSHEVRNACFWDSKNRVAESSFAHS